MEKAVKLYDTGLMQYPNEPSLIDAYTDLLLSLPDQQERARQLIERSIQLNPNKEGRKYLNYAEMLTNMESLQMYQKGIEVLHKDLEDQLQRNQMEEVHLTKKQIASAQASIADLYMTDLCDEPNAESNCEVALNEALKMDSNNIDALQSLANLRMIRNKDDEARELLGHVYS